ncbi:aquaporin [Pengzhenrongella frigida]|nr:aquaporin [Cellulomonas sp. HLT2-17]
MSQDTPDLTPTTNAIPATAAPVPDEVALDLVVVPVRPSLLVRLGTEALGSFLLVLAAIGILLYTPLTGASALGTALGLGLAVVGGTIAFGHVSGGHFNPAITFGAAIAGRSPWREVLPYWLAQVVGGALAAAALFLTIPSALPTLVSQGAETTTRAFFGATANGFGAHSPLATLTTGEASFELLPALLIEILGTALLVGVVLGATNRVAKRLAPFAIGLTYAALVLIASPITNGGLNPARSTAAALFSESSALGQLWLFWVAPLVGAALAGLAYRAFATSGLGTTEFGTTVVEDDEFDDDLLEEDEIIVTDERG